MTRTGLRPLSVGEILDGAFTIYREHFGALVLVAAICGLPALAAAFLLPEGVAPLLEAVTGFVSFAALTWMSAELAFGRRVDVKRGLGIGLRKAPWVFLCFLAVGLVSAGIFMLAALVGLLLVSGLQMVMEVSATMRGIGVAVAGIGVMIVMSLVIVRYFAVAQIVVLEPGRHVLKRSAELAKGAFWRISIVWTVAFLVVVVPSLMIGLGIGFLETIEEDLRAAQGQTAAAALVFLATVPLVTWLVNALTAPFTAAIGVVLYVDQRVRKDGLDIELAIAPGAGGSDGGATSLASA